MTPGSALPGATPRAGLEVTARRDDRPYARRPAGLMLRVVIATDVRRRLEEERRGLLATIAREEAELATPLEDSGEDLTASQHPADVASGLAYRESTLLTELSLREAVAEIDDALARLAHGTYGICVDCARAIDPERLGVRPQAARCVACQRLKERSAPAR